MTNARTRMRSTIAGALAIAAAMALRGASAETPESLADQVRATETAFASSMANRDFSAFALLVSEEAVFFGSKAPHQGKAAILDAWKPLFDGPKAPFSWKPDVVIVLASGTLAHSSGPVFDPDGKIVAQFNSVWRREPGGKWRIVFDKGCDVCNCTPAQ